MSEEPALSSHRELLRRIVDAYDSPITRAYCTARFFIINVNILDILRLSLRGRRRILEVGCGFGLIGCYLASSDPDIEYVGVDLDEGRIAAAKLTAERLGLLNIRFEVGDARTLQVEKAYDAALMVDLVHHLPIPSRQPLFDQIMDHLGHDGRLVIKDIVPRPWWKLFWTWALDVAMTRGTDMWYWNETQFRDAIVAAVGSDELSAETYPISDWLPYPHIAYIFERRPEGGEGVG